MADTVYLNCKTAEKTFPDGGTLLNVRVKAEVLAAFLEQHTGADGWLRLTIKRRKAVGQFGDTHSVVLDTFKPTPKAPTTTITADDIPF